EEIFLGSSDWMNRNIYRRIEVCFPVYEQALKEEISSIIRLQLADTLAAVEMNANSENVAVDPPLTPTTPQGDPPLRSQEAIYQYLVKIRT
ncbi:MAG TPA: hypothetical protein VK518_09985, partial [Puia sp.]|nr:hypothetical protein [Puia sp.]